MVSLSHSRPRSENSHASVPAIYAGVFRVAWLLLKQSARHSRDR